MARDDTLPSAIADALFAPRLSILGEIDAPKVEKLIGGLRQLESGAEPVAIEVCTVGGDAEIARHAVLEIQATRARLGRRLLFLGKTTVYSAGITIMSAFPREDRYLTADTSLMIHCRQLEKTAELDGPIRSSLPLVESLRHQIEAGIAIEEDNFERLIEGSEVSLDQLFERALCNWYLTASEACELRLAEAVVDITVPRRRIRAEALRTN